MRHSPASRALKDQDRSALARLLTSTVLFAAIIGVCTVLGMLAGVAHAMAETGRAYDIFADRPVSSGATDKSAATASPRSTFVDDPWAVDWIDPWEAPRRIEDFENASAPASDAPTLGDAGYWPLLRAISMYRNIVEWGGWDSIPAGEERFEEGLVDEVRVPLLRKRLIATGDLESSGGNPTVFDAQLTQALQRFQARNGLLPDGVVGRRTLEALNVSAKARLALLERNLKRINKLKLNLGERYIFVNIAGQKLEAVANGRVERRHRVVIGKVDRQTPEYTSKITFLAFNPYWHVPQSIAEKDILPQVRRDPSYLRRLNMKVYRGYGGSEVNPSTVNWNQVNGRTFLFRQEPGPRNSLGTVKIHFPNPHAVYLHDTPSKSLFGRSVRANSSGCVRVEDVHDLTTWLLDAQGWDRSRVDALVKSGQRKDIYLKKTVPVYMLYLTAWVDEHGVVNFRDDIYGRDSRRASL
jgi:murein L,D-transpeptidase YcbB/YkuD